MKNSVSPTYQQDLNLKTIKILEAENQQANIFNQGAARGLSEDFDKSGSVSPEVCCLAHPAE